MKASFVDLRKKSAEIIRALDRKEEITLLYRGKPKAIVRPIGSQRPKASARAKDDPAFGLWADRDDLQDVARHVRTLRKGRYDAL